MKLSSKRPLIVLFIVISVICILFFAAINKFNAPLANAIVVNVLAPFQSVTSTISSKCNDFRNYVYDVFYVYDQNRELKAQNDDLKLKVARTAELEAENASLRQLLNYKKANLQFDLLPANVIGRDMATWSSHIIINRGTNDGVQKNMTVITPDGLVGNIREAYPSYSEVELITDPRSAVGSIVQRADSRVAGVVKGSADSNSAINMTNIPQNANIIEGDTIITSGFGGIYPKGIPIGTVASIQNDSGGLLQYAILYPCVDFQKLENVAVIINHRELAAPVPATPTPTQQQAPQQQPATNNQQQATPAPTQPATGDMK